MLSWEYRSPQKRNSRPPASVILCWVSWVENVLLIYYASSDLFVCLHWKKSPVYGIFDSNLHTRLAIVTENELGLAFPPRNLPKKFRPDPSTFYLVIMVTNKETDRQTNAGKNIIPRFRGDNYVITGHCVFWNLILFFQVLRLWSKWNLQVWDEPVNVAFVHSCCIFTSVQVSCWHRWVASVIRLAAHVLRHS